MIHGPVFLPGRDEEVMEPTDDQRFYTRSSGFLNSYRTIASFPTFLTANALFTTCKSANPKT
jgi:hypothetical protein